MMEESPLVPASLPEGLTVGFLGVGHMGSAVARALVTSGALPGGRLVVYNRSPERAQELERALGAQRVTSQAALLAASDVVVLACKPQDAEAALASMSWPDSPRSLISVAAGLTLSWLQERVPPQVRVARVMPNVAAQVGAGVTGVLRSQDPALHSLVKNIFATCGQVVVLEKESLFNAMTAISGSGPAYLFLIMEALADGGVKLGLPRAMAQELAVHTVRGAAELVIQTGEHPARLREQVSSPGGMTICGLSALEDAGVRGAMMRAVESAARRGDALGEG